MPILKPTRGLKLNKSHPFSRGLAGCWLLNEGSGGKIFDCSGNNNAGNPYGDISWSGGRFGSALSFDGSDDYFQVPYSSLLNSTIFTISIWAKVEGSQGTWRSLITSRDGAPCRGYMIYASDSNRWELWIGNNEGDWKHLYGSSIVLDKWTHLVAVYNNPQMLLYVDGIIAASDNSGFMVNTNRPLRIGAGFTEGSPTYYFNGKIDNASIYNYGLSMAEIAWLYREPFCMFERSINPAVLFMPIINLTGTFNTQSTTWANAKLTKRIKGSSAAILNVTATLKITGEFILAGSIDTSVVLSGRLTLSYRCPWLHSPLKIERHWLTDALFNGMTASAFKLGTILSGGWFWIHRTDCSALYRGPSMGKIDFMNILATVEQKDESILLTGYTPHNNNSVYFYVIRRINNCGYQECTLQAAVMVSIDADGNLTQPQPNNIFAARATQVDGDKVQLVWFYCPIEQRSEPVCFKVYYNDGMGQIDFGNGIAEIAYHGIKYYSYTSDSLSTGRYLFAIRAEGANGSQNNSFARLEIQISTQSHDAADILCVEAI